MNIYRNIFGHHKGFEDYWHGMDGGQRNLEDTLRFKELPNARRTLDVPPDIHVGEKHIYNYLSVAPTSGLHETQSVWAFFFCFLLF